VCPEHGFEARALDVETAAHSAAQSLGGARGVVTYPLRVPGTEAYLEVREGLLRDGYRRLWLGGKTEDLDALKPSLAIASGALEVIVDRVGSGKTKTPWRRASKRPGRAPAASRTSTATTACSS